MPLTERSPIRRPRGRFASHFCVAPLPEAVRDWRRRPNFFEALALRGTVLYLIREDTAALAALRRGHELRMSPCGVGDLKFARQLHG